MSREYNLYLRDILEVIGKIERYTRGMDYEEFLADDLVQDGVIRNLMVIGEAVKLIPEPNANTPIFPGERLQECETSSFTHTSGSITRSCGTLSGTRSRNYGLQSGRCLMTRPPDRPLPWFGARKRLAPPTSPATTAWSSS